MSMASIQSISDSVAEAVSEYNGMMDSHDHIDEVALFGSYAEERATDKSDVDLLVTFRSSVVSLFTLAQALMVMERHLGKNVDLVQNPLPEDTLLNIRKVVPLYEG